MFITTNNVYLKYNFIYHENSCFQTVVVSAKLMKYLYLFQTIQNMNGISGHKLLYSQYRAQL